MESKMEQQQLESVKQKLLNKCRKCGHEIVALEQIDIAAREQIKRMKDFQGFIKSYGKKF